MLCPNLLLRKKCVSKKNRRKVSIIIVCAMSAAAYGDGLLSEVQEESLDEVRVLFQP